LVGDLYGPASLLPLLRVGALPARTAAATALGLLADTTATRVLLEVLASDAAPVRQQASRSLRRITGESWGDDSDAWRRWWETLGTGQRP
jgi:hypothetical protein